MVNNGCFLASDLSRNRLYCQTLFQIVRVSLIFFCLGLIGLDIHLIKFLVEEVRMSFIEAQKTGSVQQHINELSAQYNDAVAKLNQLKMATPETIQLVANIYNLSVQQSDQSKSPVSTPTNAFAPPQQQQNPFSAQTMSAVGSGSVFGSSQQAASMTSSNIFGAAPSSNPFQVTAQSSIFGSKEPPASTTSNFTFSLGQQAPQQSLFASSMQSPPQSSIFGPSMPVQQPQMQSSIFGSSQPVQQQQLAPSNSIFGSSQTVQQQQPAPNGSIFGSQANPFGSVFAAPQQPQQAASSFATPMFAAPPQPAPMPGVFGQTDMTAPFQTQRSSFGQEMSVTTGNAFGQPAVAPSQNIFAMQQPAPSQQPASGPIFQIQQASSQAFGANPFQTQPPPIDESVFSKPEDLSPEELATFQVDRFELGKIPLKPPPKNLCS